MKLQRLELIGFKSFMNKMVLHFEDGITSIVGPNGCGKSNIVDAIFWVMGDQSAKHLRGSEMGDVIFAGSEQHPPASMAEVSLTLSTEDGQVPVEYSHFSEITVSRRLFRSGESEYYINKTACRLKDIVELFMDTGLGARSYAIIEQGHIEKIVGQKTSDRRTFIEEAAGIMKFKSRRHEAELKMSATEQNLLRINDILSEIKRQINSLERQAKRAEQYKAIKTKIREIELSLISCEYTAAMKQLSEVESKVEKQKQKHQAVLIEIQKLESYLEKIKLGLTEREKSLQSIQQEVYQIQQNIQRQESQKEVKKKEVENWRSLAFKDETAIRHLEDKKEQIEKSQRNILDALTLLEKEELELQTSVKNEERQLEHQSERHRQLRDQIEEAKTQLLLIVTEQAKSQNRISSIEERKNDIETDEERLAMEEKKLYGRQKDIEERKKSMIVMIQRGQIDAQKNAMKKQEIQKQLEELKTLYIMKTSDLEIRKDRLHQVSTRIQSLQELQQNFEGYHEGVKALLSNQDKSAPKIMGMMADMVETDEKYEQAVESILGHKLQCLLVHDRDAAFHALNFLNKTKSGKACLLPLEPCVFKEMNNLDDSAAEPLWRKLRIHPSLKEIIRQLLKDIYIVSDLDCAIRIWDRYPGQYSFVTLTGEWVTSDGILYGGRQKEIEKGILKQKREIKNLEREKTELEQGMIKFQKEMQEQQLAMEKLTHDIQVIQEALHREEVSETGHKKDVSQCEDELQEIAEEIEVLNLEKDQISLQKQELLEEFEKEKKREHFLGRKHKTEQTVIESAQMAFQSVEHEIEDCKKRFMDGKIMQASLREKKDALNRQKDHLGQNFKNISDEIEEKREEIRLANERRDLILKEIEHSDLQLEELVKDAGYKEEKLSELKILFNQDFQKARALEEGLKKERLVYQHIESEIHENMLKVSQCQMSVKHLAEQVRDRYALDLNAVSERYNNKIVSEEDKRELTILKEKVTHMGEINLMALEEYEELRKRYESLESQKQDLVSSLESLKKTIEKINRISRKQFEETFNLINANFKKVFPMLFGGGRAELVLTDENNLLETGIEIIAKPPGKKQQSISLLSGGEKALTAVSLIFAAFLMKPSPFCLLDEVDAPLDDANVGRFTEMVRQMTPKSQFVLITHNKKTMSMADVLYGITMESPGVSILVSVKLDRAVELSQKKIVQPGAISSPQSQ